MQKTPDPNHPVYALVGRIPRGKVLTYGLIAQTCGIKTPRYVGYLLHHNPDPESIPCHRVVNAAGKCAANFAFGMARAQEQLLIQEGVKFTGGKVDLKAHLWWPTDSLL